MSEFGGVVRFDDSQAALNELGPRLEPNSVDGGVLLSRSNARFAYRRSSFGRAADLGDGWVDEGAQGLLLFDGRLDDRADLRTRLASPSTLTNDPALAAAALRRFGPEAARHLYGDYCFAWWDQVNFQLVLSRDALGMRTLYYRYADGVVQFATQLAALATMPGVVRRLDDHALVDLMTRNDGVTESTIYQGLSRVPQAGVVILSRDGVSVERHWDIDRAPALRFRRDQDYVEAALERFDSAVAARIESDGPIAAELSGGLDSSAVAVTAARMLAPAPIAAYTRAPGFGALAAGDMDEARYAGLAAAQTPSIRWATVDDDAPHESELRLEQHWPQMGFPWRNPSQPIWLGAVVRRAAADGARVLLCGDAGNYTMSWQGSRLVPELLRSFQWARAFGEMRAERRQTGASWAWIARNRIASGLTPASLRTWWRQRGGVGLDWLARTPFSPEFLNAIAYREHSRRNGHYQLALSSQSVRAMRLSLLQTEHPREVAGVQRAAYGIDRRSPFLDRRLIETLLSFPESQFNRAGTSRWLARRAFAGRLPAETLGERRMGRQFPEWPQRVGLYLEGLLEELAMIERSPLASRVLDVDRLRRALARWPSDRENLAMAEAEYTSVALRGIYLGSFLRWFENP